MANFTQAQEVEEAIDYGNTTHASLEELICAGYFSSKTVQSLLQASEVGKCEVCSARLLDNSVKRRKNPGTPSLRSGKPNGVKVHETRSGKQEVVTRSRTTIYQL